ncbi:hypothetical protein ACR31S_04025 [Streptococcus iniae]
MTDRCVRASISQMEENGIQKLLTILIILIGSIGRQNLLRHKLMASLVIITVF